jgi:DNA-binding LacI/PurR family transcriptional regulator
MVKRITISDVAKRAKVSPTAVSFAFNKPELLSQETLERIRNVAEEIGYAPNALARALANQKLGVLGVLAPRSMESVFGDVYYTEFLRGVGSACGEHMLDLLVLSSLNGSLESALSRAVVDGFIINGFSDSREEIAFLRKRRIPCVIVDGDAAALPSVNINDEPGTKEAAAHLLARGHRDIAVLAFGVDPAMRDQFLNGIAQKRIAGYQRAFAERNVAWRKDCLFAAVNSVAGGEAAMQLALSRGHHPTAVLALSDAIALGALRTIQQAGLRVPEDIEVIGFDDLALATQMPPMLSTVHQPIYGKGRCAVEMLMKIVADPHFDDDVVLPARLVLRETTR